jgi:hypothetical protein
VLWGGGWDWHDGIVCGETEKLGIVSVTGVIEGDIEIVLQGD